MPYMTDFMRNVKAHLAQLMLGISGSDWQTQSSRQTPTLKEVETIQYHLRQ